MFDISMKKEIVLVIIYIVINLIWVYFSICYKLPYVYGGI